MTLRTLLFDLDGTLADTGPDLAFALNRMLADEQRAELPYERIRPQVSHGGAALLHLGFPELRIDSAAFDALRLRMLAVYRANIARRAACIVSGGTTAHKKPHPAPMLLACNQSGSAAPQCLYIGDAQRDIQAGRNAGMPTRVALFGYLGGEDRPENWGADGLVNTPQDILDWI